MSLNLVAIDQQRPTDWPISLDMAKKHLRIEHGEEDDLIQIYIDAAVDYALQYTGNSFAITKYRLYLDDWPTEIPAYLRKPPFRAVVGIFYTDVDGAEQALPSEQINVKPYSLIGDVTVTGTLPAVQEGVSKIYVEYVAGYGRYLALSQDGFPYTLPIIFGVAWAPQRDMPDIDAPLIFEEDGSQGSSMSIPASIKSAILMHTAHLYENRETVGATNLKEVPMATEALLDRHRVYGV